MEKSLIKDSAVSPVIGTILLVAITVVLVAIISAVVMGMSGNVNSNYVVGISVDTPKTTADNYSIRVGLESGADIQKLTAIKVTINNTATTIVPTTPESTTWPNKIGESAVYKTDGTLTIPNEAKSLSVVVVGDFNDGTSQILYDKEKSFPAKPTT